MSVTNGETETERERDTETGAGGRLRALQLRRKGTKLLRAEGRGGEEMSARLVFM